MCLSEEQPQIRQRCRTAGPRLRTIAFSLVVAFLALFWLVGQVVTLRWQTHHLLTHQPEVERERLPSAR